MSENKNEVINTPEIEIPVDVNVNQNGSEKTEPTMDDKLNEILKHDFSSDVEFNMDENYKLIEGYKFEINNLKASEADTVIIEVGPKYINKDYQTEMDKVKEHFYSLIKKYDPNSDIIKNMTESEKTKIYTIAQFIMNSYINMINNMMFNITWTRKEYKFLQHAFRNTMEYTGNEIFNSIDLKEQYLDKWEEIDGRLPKTIESFEIAIDIKNIVLMYHFLGTFKIKGMTQQYYTFIDILKKIADTNKIFNAFSIIRERIQMDFMNWSAALDPNSIPQGMSPDSKESAQ